MVKEDIRNENEFRVFAMRRSGHHAIVNWVASMCSEPVYYFNSCSLGKSPFNSARTSRGDKYNTELCDMYVQTGRHLEDEQRFINKKYLMYDYEDKKLHEISKFPIPNKGVDVGNSNNEYEILIMRDLFNWVASLIVMRGEDRKTLYEDHPDTTDFNEGSAIWGGGYRKVWKRLSVWEEYAKELLGETQYLTNKVCIFFDKWFSNVKYRQYIANALSLPYNEVALSYIGSVADSASSFDGDNYEGRAQEMKVLERWKVFKDNQIYWDIFRYEKYKHLVALNTRIHNELNLYLPQECSEKGIFG